MPMTGLSKDQRQKALDAWEKACQAIENLYNLKPNRETPEIRLSTPEDKIPEHHLGALNNEQIIINTAIPEYEKVIPAIMAKFCLESVLPSDILCRQCIDDMTFEFARRSIKETGLRKHWDDIWLKHSPPQLVSRVIRYSPSVGYRWLHSVAGEKGLDTFINELVLRGKSKIPLYFEDYLRYFSIRVKRFENSLDATELKLTKTIIERPELQTKEISELLGFSEEWVSRKLTQLQKRMILRKFTRAPFSRIGINMFQVLLSGTDSELDAYKLLKNYPFLFAYRNVVSGDWNAMATLCIPENRESLQLLKAGLKIIEKTGFVIDLHQYYSAGGASCFDYYDPKTGKWDIPWELLTIHLQRIHSDHLADSIPRIDRPENRVDIELDELDMQIIDCIREGLVSVSKIRSKLKVGQHRIAEKLKRLRDNGLIVRTWEAHNIGLNENAVIYCKKKDVGKSIAAWALRLPRTLVTFSTKEEVLLVISLPKGGSFGLATAINELDTSTSVGFLSQQVQGMWDFPIRLWDSRFQRWKCPKEDLEAWIEQIE